MQAAASFHSSSGASCHCHVIFQHSSQDWVTNRFRNALKGGVLNLSVEWRWTLTRCGGNSKGGRGTQRDGFPLHNCWGYAYFWAQGTSWESWWLTQGTEDEHVNSQDAVKVGWWFHLRQCQLLLSTLRNGSLHRCQCFFWLMGKKNRVKKEKEKGSHLL